MRLRVEGTARDLGGKVQGLVGRAVVGGRLLVAGINHEGSAHAVALARDAAEAGADAVMVFAPFSWALGVDPRAVVAHHRATHDATDLPLFLFQGSVGAGRTRFAPEVLTKLLRLERVVGIKEGSWQVAVRADPPTDAGPGPGCRRHGIG